MSTADNFDRIWAAMPAADRLVLLGHSRDHLTSAEKVMLAQVARAQIAGPATSPRPDHASTRRSAATAGRTPRDRRQPQSATRRG